MVFEGYRRPYTSAEPLPFISSNNSSLIGVGGIARPWAQIQRDRLSLGSVQSSERQFPWDIRYVASSTRHGKGLDMDALERRKREREMAMRYRNVNSTTGARTDWSGSGRSFKARIVRAPTRMIGSSFLPTTAKQIYFVLNGRPSQIYRSLLNPLRSLDFDNLLEEVSQGLQKAIHKLYTYEGETLVNMEQLLELKDNRVLAVPRNERLLLHGRSYSDVNGPTISGDKIQQNSLPPIRRVRDSSDSSSGNQPLTTRRYADRRYNPNQQQGNSIERPLKSTIPVSANILPPPPDRKRYVSSLLNRREQQKPLTNSEILTSKNSLISTSQLTSRSREHKNFPKIRDQPIMNDSQTRLNKRSDRRKRYAGPPPISDAMQAKINEEATKQAKWNANKVPVDKPSTAGPIAVHQNSNSNTADSDSGRPRSSNDFSNGGITTTATTPFHPDESAEFDEGGESEGDDEMEHDEVEEDSADDYPQQPPGIFDEEGIDTETLARVSEENVMAQMEDNNHDEMLNYNYGLAEERAAIKIQAATRGYLARKRYKVVKFQLNGKEPENDHKLIKPGTPVPRKQTRLQNSKPNTPQSRQSTAKSIKSIQNSELIQAENQNVELENGERVKREMNEDEDRPTSQENNLEEIEQIVEDDRKEEEEAKVEIDQNLNEKSEIKPDAQKDIQSDELEPTNGTLEIIEEEKQVDAPEILEPEYDHEHPPQPTTESADSSETEDEDDILSKRTKGPKDVDSYSVTVKVGNRWAADSETELYISMVGDKKESAKFYMRQKYVNWLESEQLNYVQQASDTFQMQIECGFLGIIRRLIIGHDSIGYGAGIFIDRVIITEDAANGRAYLFQCHKWLDSGQVDGKIERILRLTAFCDMDPIPHAMERVTNGRWEVVLNSGDIKGNGGTTSNLRLVGFGTRGSAELTIKNESELQKVPSKTLMQCHFKGIGELLKLRVEIDGNGESPDYFLEQVELRDLDTQDRCVVACGKWLRWQSSRKGDQPFREFLTFRLGAEPLPLITYDGKMRISPPQFPCVDSILKMELVGDIGETGVVLLDLGTATEKAGKMELSFKIEAVSIGKLNTARLYMQPNDIGEQIYEGFSVLQQIWDKRDTEISQLIPLATTGNDWLINMMYVREGAHTPYRYVLNNSRIRPRSASNEPFVKELKRSALEGMSTRMSKRKSINDHITPSWLLSMCLGEDSRLFPQVYLCGTKDSALMAPLSDAPTDNLLSYQLKDSDLGNICKVRLKTDQKSLLKLSEYASSSTSDSQPMVYIRKMRLSDNANGDEIRFPSADVEMNHDSIVEFPTFWPDRPPYSNILYEAHIVTGASNVSPSVPIWLNIFGDFGDVSYRRLQTLVEKPEKPLFSADSNCTFEFEAVSIGVLKTAEITVECEQSEFLWECSQLIINGSLNGQSYVFQFPRAFTAKNNRQNASVLSLIVQ